MLPRKLRKRQILSVNQNLSSVYFSVAKFQPVSCNLYLAMISQMTYTHKVPKLCSATLSWSILVGKQIKREKYKSLPSSERNFCDSLSSDTSIKNLGQQKPRKRQLLFKNQMEIRVMKFIKFGFIHALLRSRGKK